MELFDLSPGALLAGMLVSTIGMGLFVYGKRAERLPQILAGLALMVFPVFVHGAVAVLAVGGLIVGGLWLGVRQGL
jgi:hypothetical protein